MNILHFASSNIENIRAAQLICSDAYIEISPIALDIDEIQGEDPEIIVKDKAKRAYEKLKHPVVVSDDSWDFKALGGFPGPYMKSINHWFDPEDFLRLMSGIEDRRVSLHEYLAYTDGQTVKIFKNERTGKIIHESRGDHKKVPATNVISLDADNGKTIAEIYKLSPDLAKHRHQSKTSVWDEFIGWYKTLV